MPARKSSSKKSKSAKKSPTRKNPGTPAKKPAVNFVPAGYHTVTPYITVKGGVTALDFYQKAFGAKEKGRLTMPDGTIGHAEIQIGDSFIMLADENPQWGNRSPATLGGTPAGICLYVKNVDAFFEKAVKAGARVEQTIQDQFYGDRSGTLVDPFGHKWTIATHQENVSFREMQKRADKMFHEG